MKVELGGPVTQTNSVDMRRVCGPRGVHHGYGEGWVGVGEGGQWRWESPSLTTAMRPFQVLRTKRCRG